MSATEELRRLLDERGVEWRRTPHYSSESQDNETIFEGNGIEWYANDHMNGRLGLRALRYEVTPEQAIEATLGSDLKAENAKLRELVRDMYACISHANEQDWFYFERDKLGCGMSCTVNGEACGLCALADRMRELGVEVDE